MPIEETDASSFFNEEKENGDDSFKQTLEYFFKIDDDIGLSKTDLKPKEIRPLIKLLQHSNNLTPKYNDYLESINQEEKQITGEYIKDFIKDYILGKISKDREGRKEGESIAKNKREQEEKDIEDEFQDMIKELSQ